MAPAATDNPTLPVHEMITAPVIIPMSTLVPAAFSLSSIGFLNSHVSYHVFGRGVVAPYPGGGGLW